MLLRLYPLTTHFSHHAKGLRCPWAQKPLTPYILVSLLLARQAPVKCSQVVRDTLCECATRSEGLRHRAQDSQVAPQVILLCRARGSGWTRALNAMFNLQRAGEGQDIHEKAGQSLLGTLLFLLLWQNI